MLCERISPANLKPLSEASGKEDEILFQWKTKPEWNNESNTDKILISNYSQYLTRQNIIQLLPIIIALFGGGFNLDINSAKGGCYLGCRWHDRRLRDNIEARSTPNSTRCSWA
jgi:hypothetical protein